MPRGAYTGAKFTAERQARYLEALEEGKTFAECAEKVGVSHVLVWQYRKQNPEFAERFDESREKGIESGVCEAENSLLNQAKAGNVRAIEVYLYNKAPHKWRDRRNVEIKGLDDFLRLLPPELARQLGKVLRRVLAENPVGTAGGSAGPDGRANGRPT